ncbi:unnamed protein product, partial [Closterium sp. NIES-54]
MALGSAGQVLSVAESRVEVRVMEAVGLSVGNGQLAVGEEMAVFPTGGHEGEDLLSFSRVCHGYQWSVSHNQVSPPRHVTQMSLVLVLPSLASTSPIPYLSTGRVCSFTPTLHSSSPSTPLSQHSCCTYKQRHRSTHRCLPAPQGRPAAATAGVAVPQTVAVQRWTLASQRASLP